MLWGTALPAALRQASKPLWIALDTVICIQKNIMVVKFWINRFNYAPYDCELANPAPEDTVY